MEDSFNCPLSLNKGNILPEKNLERYLERRAKICSSCKFSSHPKCPKNGGKFYDNEADYLMDICFKK